MSSSTVQLENFRIPLEEIILATRNFSRESLIGSDGFGMIHEGQLSEGWQNRFVTIKRHDPFGYQGREEFHNELMMLSSFYHQNIVAFIGYCDDGNEMIVVHEYAFNGRLADHLQSPEKSRRLSWTQRLKICIGAATGLQYLHSCLGEHHGVIHRNINSATVLLDANLEAKIYDFGFSKQGPGNQQNTQIYTKAAGTNFYLDPVYSEGGILSYKSDVYSFGIVLFEMLSGTLAYVPTKFVDGNPQYLINLVRRYYNDGPEKLIDPILRDQIDSHSFHVFKELAYQCISLNSKERPTMDTIIAMIEDARGFQRAASTITVQSHRYQKLESLLIPLEEISLATRDFSHETRIGDGEFGVVYKGQLSQRWQNRSASFTRYHHTDVFGEQEFHEKVMMISSFNHENIIDFIGYCDEENEMIIVSEYTTHGNLDHHLQDPIKIRCITWMQRLKICLGVAKALKYLHSGLGEDSRIIHRDVTSANILLNDNLEAKICGFHLSLVVHHNKPQVYENVVGTEYYLDPVYNESGIVETNSDVYSFGVVMFEMLSGMLACQGRSIDDDDDEQQKLISLVRRYYDDGLDSLIDPNIRDRVNSRSSRVFKEIAYQCLSWNVNDRPTMNTIIKMIEEALHIHSLPAMPTITKLRNQHQNLQRFLIPMKEIRLATEDFSLKTQIGADGFGVVYKGQLSQHWQNRIASFKRLDPNGGFGEEEFLNKVDMISNFKHENIIPFIGYCDEGNEKIVVYEYAINGSLSDHLQDPDKIRLLTWAQRLNICIGAARGLHYLHTGLGEDNRVVHRDINGENILLDDKLEAKICGFGLSLELGRDRPQVYVGVQGTPYYLDPIYRESGIVKIESDVYSFGVILFEMLIGMLACEERSIGYEKPQKLINLVRRYYDDGPGTLADPLISDQINIHSLHEFKKIAYRCISLNLKDRPTTNRIIHKIEEALLIHKHGAASTITTPSHQLDNFLIPIKEINLATRNFNFKNLIGVGGFGKVYKGQLSEHRQNCIVAIKRFDPNGHQGKKEFASEVKLIASFHHQNIIPFVGYCEEDKEMIIVSKYATNGSLDYHLRDPSRKTSLTWAQRLKICLGAAKGLDYLHSGLGKDYRVIHGDIKSGNILLDENLEAKICDFGLFGGLGNKQLTNFYVKAAGNNFYLDPVYHESGILSEKSDVYSFGVVLFEMLSGTLAFIPTKFVDDSPQFLINLVRRYYSDGLRKLIDPILKDQIDSRSFHVFKELAYQCISLKTKERPTMETIIDMIDDAMDFQKHGATFTITTPSYQDNFLIPIEEIKLATRDFNIENLIGVGGFGKVYKGQLSEHRQNCIVAIKRFDPNGHQGKKEFASEVKLIASFHHQNIIPFVGYCEEDKEMILVSKYATNGSLDYHLRDPSRKTSLTWAQRLKICLGAAKGLDYLHSDRQVIHRDVKSGNILLDGNLEAKICDFGLSKEGLGNQQLSKFYTNAAGTDFYLDPVYREGGIVSKKSDVYSFGVVLFEMLSGTLAYVKTEFVDDSPQHLKYLVRRYYNDGPKKLIDPVLRDQIDSHSFHIFKELAYQCISLNPEERPTMDTIIIKIKDAMNFQHKKEEKLRKTAVAGLDEAAKEAKN